jgi:putative two-component system response regulator
MLMATILIVDDTPENLAVLSGLLGRHYRIRAVSSGQRALRVADSEPRPDLILLDVMMPGLDGYQVIERLQANPRTADIPVIFITAREASDDEQRGLALGAVDYITKPIRPAIVSARVKTHLELKAARDWLHDRNRSLEEEVTRRMADTLRVEDVSIRALARLAEVPRPGNRQPPAAYAGLRTHPGHGTVLASSVRHLSDAPQHRTAGQIGTLARHRQGGYSGPHPAQTRQADGGRGMRS